MQPDPFLAIYGATKSYVTNFTEALSYELRGTGATTTVVSPGATASDFFDAAQMRESRMAVSKLMTANEVAKIGFDALIKGKRHVITGFMNRVKGFFSGMLSSSNFKLRIAANVLGKK